MKKLVTMFVMMMMVLVVSCANESTDSDDGGSTGGGGLKESTATQLAITAGSTTFANNGAGTIPPVATTTGVTFKASFLTGAIDAYKTSDDYVKPELTDIVLGTEADSATDFDTALVAGDYVITLTVKKTGEKSKSFTYKFTTV